MDGGIQPKVKSIAIIPVVSVIPATKVNWTRVQESVPWGKAGIQFPRHCEEGSNPVNSKIFHHAKHQDFQNAIREGLPALYHESREKGRTKSEVDTVILWLTGYDAACLARILNEKIDFETFFREAPHMHPNRTIITGSICGYKIAEIEDPLMRNIRYLDKLVDELSKGKEMGKILRIPGK